MFEQIKWLFFDVGSTLVDEQLAYERRLRDIAEQAGLSFQQVLEKALAYYRRNQKGDLETAKSLGISLHRWYTECERPYPDAAECLASLHQKYSIGIIANQLAGTSNRLEQYGLLPFIDLVISSAEEGISKPDPKIFELALSKSECQPGFSVMIGDRIDNDVLPAKSIGMHTIWIKQGFGQYWNITQENEKPDAVVHHLSELCSLL